MHCALHCATTPRTHSLPRGHDATHDNTRTTPHRIPIAHQLARHSTQLLSRRDVPNSAFHVTTYTLLSFSRMHASMRMSWVRALLSKHRMHTTASHLTLVRPQLAARCTSCARQSAFRHLRRRSPCNNSPHAAAQLRTPSISVRAHPLHTVRAPPHSTSLTPRHPPLNSLLSPPSLPPR